MKIHKIAVGPHEAAKRWKYLDSLKRLNFEIDQSMSWRLKEDMLKEYPSLQKVNQDLLNVMSTISQISNTIREDMDKIYAERNAVYNAKHRKIK